MASRLAPCPSCTRHFKVGSLSCPFCGADVPLHVATRGVALLPGRTLTRAALMFAGVAIVAGCSGKTELEDAGPGPEPAADAGTTDDGGVVVHFEDASPEGPHCGVSPAAYGVFTVPDACTH